MSSPVERGGLLAARVLRGVDRSPLTVDRGGTTERLGPLRLDTSEALDLEALAPCFGREAGDRAAVVRTGTTVREEADDFGTQRDRYGRLLGSRWVDGRTFTLDRGLKMHHQWETEGSLAERNGRYQSNHVAFRKDIGWEEGGVHHESDT